MQPWTIALPSTLTIMEADQYLELTHQVSLPVVDSAGHLVGICHRKATSGSLLSDSVTEVTESDIQSFPMDTPFTELCTFFENGGEEYAAIHDGDKLAGYVTRDSVASLMDAIHHDTFADRLSDLTTSDYLRVRDSRFFA
jgi:CBS-domain-containing membrane protein